MPLPVKNALNNIFLSNASNEGDILPRPYRLINNFISHYQLPFDLLIHHIPDERSLVLLQLGGDLAWNLALPNSQPLPHRSHEGDELICKRNLPEVFRDKPVVLLNKERFAWGD